jgi:hypothetical protein
MWREGCLLLLLLLLRRDLHNLLLLPLTSTVIISFLLPPSFWALLFIGATAVVQLIQNIHYTWTQNKKKWFTHLHVITTLTRMVTIRIRYAVWDWACETITHNSEQVEITWSSADKVLVLQDIARTSS